MAAYGPLAAASAVRQFYEQESPQVPLRSLMDSVAQSIHTQLYTRNEWAPGGALAEAIVRLSVFYKSLGHDVVVVTTNYDSNLEQFAGDEEAKALARKYGIKIQAFHSDDELPASEVLPVYHLHGYVPFRGKARGNLAFSEAGLFQGGEIVKGTKGPAGIDWRSQVLRRRFEISTTVFLGTTLRDPAVVRSLTDTRRATKKALARYGVFAQQGDGWAAASDEICEKADRVLRARLEHLNVTPVRPDFFGQVSQLLNEVFFCASFGRRYVGEAQTQKSRRYGGRLNNWWRKWSAALEAFGEPKKYQDRCQEVLADAKVQVLDLRGFVAGRAEVLKLEAWVRIDPERTRTLELWGSSEAASRSTFGAHRCEIEDRSRYAAVRAFCQGQTIRGPLEEANSRWKSYFSVPITLSGDPWYEVPVGVVNLMSTEPLEESALDSLRSHELYREVRDLLIQAGTDLLDPRSSVWTE